MRRATSAGPIGREDGKRAEAGAAAAPGMDRVREEGCLKMEDKYKVQELEDLEKGKFIFSLADLKDLCWVGTLACNLMGSIMLTWATISRHWAHLSYTDKVMFSNLWETCLEGSCWKPRDPAGYLLYGRCFIVFAVVFSIFLNLMLLDFFFQLCSPFPLECLFFAIMDTIEGITVFIGWLMYMLQLKSFKDKGPQITFLWPCFLVFISFVLFLYSDYHHLSFTPAFLCFLAILFILIDKEFYHIKCLRSPRVIPKDPSTEKEKVNLEPMESPS